MMQTTREHDFAKLRGRIISSGNTLASFARLIPMTPQNLSNKLNNKSVFDSDQMTRIAELLGVSDAEDFCVLFFSFKS